MRANSRPPGDAHVRSRVRPGFRVVAKPGQTGHRQNRCPLIGESARRGPFLEPRSRLRIGIFCENKPPKDPYNTVGFGGKKRPGRQRTLGEGGQAMDTNREHGQTEPLTPSPAGWPAGWPAEWPAGRPAVLAFKIHGFLNDFNKKIDENRRNSWKLVENR